MKTKQYQGLTGLFIATAVTLTMVAPKVALANDDDRADETRVALNQVDRGQSHLDDDPFLNQPVYLPAFITVERDAPEPTATTSYILFGVGATAGASAIVFGVLKAGATSEANDHCDDSVCLGSARDALDREQRYAMASDISTGIALVSASAGLYYWFKAKREKKQWLAAKNTVHPTAVPGGVGVSFSSSF